MGFVSFVKKIFIPNEDLPSYYVSCVVGKEVLRVVELSFLT